MRESSFSTVGGRTLFTAMTVSFVACSVSANRAASSMLRIGMEDPSNVGRRAGLTIPFVVSLQLRSKCLSLKTGRRYPGLEKRVFPPCSKAFHAGKHMRRRPLRCRRNRSAPKGFPGYSSGPAGIDTDEMPLFPRSAQRPRIVFRSGGFPDERTVNVKKYCISDFVHTKSP